MKKLILSLILILLLTFTLIGNCDWLSGYDQRIKLTIDNTKIDAALSDFPVTVFFISAQGEKIFNEFDADSDYMKCAFTSSDGTTQLYAEKEDFSWKSLYPPAQSDTYVKSTTKHGTSYWAYYATDPAKLLTGSDSINSWVASDALVTNQRFHIDLGSAKIVKKIYYENYHSTGGTTTAGVQNFTFWGSNTGAGTFDDLVYANDEGWTELTVSQNTFDQHTGSDVADPKYITVTDTTAYRYYAFKFADNYGADYMGVRRIELQITEAIYHVKVTSIASGADTDIYYYYDNDHADNTDYIGAINTTAGGHVWDSNFKAVYHMVDATTSTIVDSTSNSNDGTKKGANEPIEAAGKVGQGQDFDGSDDFITLGLFDLSTVITVESIIKPDAACIARDYSTIVEERVGTSVDDWWLRMDSGKPKAIIWQSDDVVKASNPTEESALLANTVYYIVQIADGSNLNCYVNDSAYGTSTAYDGTINNQGTASYIGKDQTASRKFSGFIDEVRVSDTNRSTAWIKGTYNTLYDTLLTYGSEETEGVTTNIMFLFSNF